MLKISSECQGEFQDSSHFKTYIVSSGEAEREELPAEKRDVEVPNNYYGREGIFVAKCLYLNYLCLVEKTCTYI